MEDEKRILLAENIYLSYSELPTKKGCRKGFLAKVNNRSCIVFRKNASISALKFLMNHFPEVGQSSDPAFAWRQNGIALAHRSGI